MLHDMSGGPPAPCPNQAIVWKGPIFYPTLIKAMKKTSANTGLNNLKQLQKYFT